MSYEIRYNYTTCPVCNEIAIDWNELTQEWTAVYVEGGVYCRCPDEKPEVSSKEARICCA